MSRARGVALLQFLLFLSATVLARSPYPEIGTADRSDPLYVQHQSSIERYYRASAQGEPLPQLRLYEYRLGRERSLQQVAARFTLPVESLATLNRLPTAAIPDGVDSLLIPSLPGLFFPDQPESRFEWLLYHERIESREGASPFQVLLPGGAVAFRFLPEERLTSMEQRHFLGSFFRFPLVEPEITSRFGYRTHPILGFRSFHRGVDLRSPRGAGVYAAAAGKVADVGRDGVLGLYVVIEHPGGYRTTYAHLSEAMVALNDRLLSGSMIGKVGSTGISTGPHLHFEIAQGEQLYDPLELLPLISQ